MKNLLSYEEHAILEFLDNEYAILEYEEKDEMRVWDIIKKAGGKDDKVFALISRMAKSITDKEKAYRRGDAFVSIFGKNPADRERAEEMAKAFFDRAKELGLDVDSLRNSKNAKHTWDTKNHHGVISLPTWSAIALWEHEITGQLSDGAWENSGPEDHWKFWHGLEVKFGRPKVVFDGYYRRIKNGYNLAGLIQYVGDRMVKIGRMGQAMGRVLTGDEAQAAEEMPETMEEFMTERSKNPTARGNYHVKYLMAILPGSAEKYYQHMNSYKEKNMRDDLALIKTAMKTAG